MKRMPYFMSAVGPLAELGPGGDRRGQEFQADGP